MLIIIEAVIKIVPIYSYVYKHRVACGGRPASKLQASSQSQARTQLLFNILVATQDKQNSFVGGQTCVKRVSVSLTGSLGYTLAQTSRTNIFCSPMITISW